jgi:hypothetical protein
MGSAMWALLKGGTMTGLPIVHMTLYKHGVGFFQRRALLEGESVELSFRVDEMNDILKSLTAIDWGGGQVLGIDYATPQNREEKLAGCSVRLADDRSFRDLLVSLRGRRIRLILEQEEQATGTLLGLDEEQAPQPYPTAKHLLADLVSLLLEDMDRVLKVRLDQVQAVEILDDRGASDLRFFLHTSLAQEAYRQVMIRLTPGQHDLSVSYIAPAPTWRVSYRLVAEHAGASMQGGASAAPNGSNGTALLQGWGIFDNRLEEDLEGISLSLVAGMPISFIYDLYTPFMPERPVVEEEARVAAAPVAFDQALGDAAPRSMAMMREGPAAKSLAAAPGPSRAAEMISQDALQQATAMTGTGEELGELFQYSIGMPVTVGRGQSAMVPILSAKLAYCKELLYNGAKLAAHPVATLRMQNETGLTLERGPVTVIEGSEYVGEALLPFTAPGGEINVPHAVALGVHVREETGSSRQVCGLDVKGSYLHVEEWHVRWREYWLSNSTDEPMVILVEHPRAADYDLFDSPAPREQTGQYLRFDVSVPARQETQLRVQERRLMSRREELQRQSHQGLRRYLRQGLIDRATHQKLDELLRLWEQLADHEKALKETDRERQKFYKAQQQIQGNMAALSTTGKEGALRARYVDQLADSEDRLQALEGKESDLEAEIERLKRELEAQIEAL